MIGVTLVQLILLGRLLVVTILDFHANCSVCIHGFERADFCRCLPLFNRSFSLYFFFDCFRLFKDFVFPRFVSNFDIGRGQLRSVPLKFPVHFPGLPVCCSITLSMTGTSKSLSQDLSSSCRSTFPAPYPH